MVISLVGDFVDIISFWSEETVEDFCPMYALVDVSFVGVKSIGDLRVTDVDEVAFIR